MKTNKFLGLGILLLLVLPIVVATTTVDSPITSGNYSSTLNVSISTNIANALSCSIWYDSTGADGKTLLTSVANTTASQTTFENAAIVISSLSDTATYNISANCTGDTDEEAVGIESITLDSTAPSLNFLVPLGGDNEDYGREVEYRCNPSDTVDTGITTTFSVTHPSEDTTSSTTLSTSGSLAKFTDTDFAGDYVFTCASTDYTGNSASESSTVTVDDLGRIQGGTGNESSGTSIWVWVGIIALAVVLLKKK